MKMTETAKNDAYPEQRQIAADILRNKKIAEEERLETVQPFMQKLLL